MKTTPQITGIVFAIYHVTDMARARQFYGDTLGMKVCLEMEFAPGLWWVEYDAGGPGALAITNHESPGMNATRNPGVALEVTNYEEVLAGVQAAGVNVVWGPSDFPLCHCFAIKDPDGNDLYFHQRRTQA